MGRVLSEALYSGAGNTFYLIDNRENDFVCEQATRLCSLKNVDGIILVEKSQKADAAMRTFNRDGSEAEMCGNGLRCLIHFLNELGMQRSVYHIDTKAGVHKGWLSGHEVCIQMPPPSQLRLHVAPNLHFINTGVPHAVFFVPSLEEINVDSEGRTLRFSPLFTPAGANINFANFHEGSLVIRTYERGVEAETLACGTGATAAALITHRVYGLRSPIAVTVRSKDQLKISFTEGWSQVFLQGPVRML